MKLEEFLEKYESMSNKDKTKIYNKFEIQDRLDFLEALTEEDKKKFIDDIRNQAVADFWTEEKKAIKEGRCSRDWTPEQIEEIMKISEITGDESINGGKTVDINGKKYYGHHMIDVHTHPEYAGDWRNIQALDEQEHYYGAHKDHNTKEPIKGFYNVSTGENEEIVIVVKENVDIFEKYLKTTICILKSNKEIKEICNTGENVTDGEMLALKKR